jgi:uncharacterized protein (DUF2336 family)
MAAYASLIADLETAIATGTVERRIDSLWHVTGLFTTGASQYSDDQIALFDDVIGRLVADIEIEARILLAQRLAAVPNAPRNVIRTLAFDDHADVATPVLTHSERLDESSLVENARTKSQKHLFAISRRRALGEPVTDVLVERGDRSVAISVAGNAGARFSERGFLALIRRSAGDDLLAERLGERREIPAHLFLRLLSIASERVRAKLRASHPQAGAEVDRVVGEVTDRMKSLALARPRDYSDRVEVLGDLHRAGRLNEADLARFAHGGRFEDTVVTLALLAMVPVSVVDRAMHGERSDVILIIARAIGLKWGTTKLILQLWSAPKLLPPVELQRSLAAFEQLNPLTAAHLLRFRATPPFERAATQS